MSGFWTSGSGILPQGTPELAFLKDFTVIPNNTMAIAKIENFNNVSKDNKYTGESEKYIHINWKIIDGEFKSREVSQKIKCFSGSAESIDRALNMLKLIMTLCHFSPSHPDAPTDDDLKKMIGKTCGIKIREYSIPKDDGSKPVEGNFVSECHQSIGFECQTGVKLETSVSIPYIPSALTRNPKSMGDFDDDVAF
jgi:hypothetical protein